MGVIYPIIQSSNHATSYLRMALGMDTRTNTHKHTHIHIRMKVILKYQACSLHAPGLIKFSRIKIFADFIAF